MMGFVKGALFAKSMHTSKYRYRYGNYRLYLLSRSKLGSRFL